MVEKKKKKDNKVLLTVRMEKGLRDLFVRTCKNNDMSASQVMRKMMRNYINNSENGGLF